MMQEHNDSQDKNMAVPQTKNEKYILEIDDIWRSKTPINKFFLNRIIKETKDDFTADAVSARGLAYAMLGDKENALETFESMLTYNNKVINQNYCVALHRLRMYKKLRRVVFDLAEKHKHSGIKLIAAGEALAQGRIGLLRRLMDDYIESIPDNKKKDEAKRQKEDSLNELKHAYESTGCTAEQLFIISEATCDIMEKYNVEVNYIELSHNKEGAYIIDLNEDDIDKVVEMNIALADEISKNDRMNGCEMVALFSVGRDRVVDKEDYAS